MPGGGDAALLQGDDAGVGTLGEDGHAGELHPPGHAVQHGNLGAQHEIGAVEIHNAVNLAVDVHLQARLREVAPLLRQQKAGVIGICKPVQNHIQFTHCLFLLIVDGYRGKPGAHGVAAQYPPSGPGRRRPAWR